MDAQTIFLVGSMAIFLGFVSDYMFRRYKAPDVLILITFGIALGPGITGLVSTNLAETISGLTPYVAALALSIIMFQAGMGLKIREVLTSFSRALVLTVLAFVASVAMVAAVGFIALGWGIGDSLLLGAILGGTSGAVVIPLVNNLRVSSRLKTVLTLESAITDVLVIVLAMSIIGVMGTGDADLGKAASTILIAFLVSSCIGVIAGFVWLQVLSTYLSGQPFSYMVTLAMLLGVYAVTEMMVNGTGGGAIAALTFGLTLANGGEVAKVIRHDIRSYVCDEKITMLHDEISFFVRTFFFIYLGIVVTTITIGLDHVLIGLAVCLAILIGRYLVTELMGRYIEQTGADHNALFFMMPRGLSAAVLASIPLSMGVVTDEVGNTILGTVTIVILVTTAIASIGAYVIDRGTRSNGKRRRAPVQEQAGLDRPTDKY